MVEDYIEENCYSEEDYADWVCKAKRELETEERIRTGKELNLFNKDTLKAVPIELKDANNFVDSLHRHHDPVYRDKFRVGCINKKNELVGVIQAGRPVSRCLDDGKTIEVVRCCTDGTYNVCSFLYSRIARIAKEMGYTKIITYILDSELGTSLKASGWIHEADTKGHNWDTPSRRRNTTAPTCNKQRWVKLL